MICPYCKITPLVVQSNNYYCPSCKIYIGSVNSLNQSSLIGFNLPAKKAQFILNQPKDAKKNFIKAYLVKFILLSIFFTSFFILTNLSSFVSLYPLCKINIENRMINGNRETIIKALELIKNTNPADFGNVCKYVKTIGEEYCPRFDLPLEKAGVERAIWNFGEGGCYIKGSKIIYLEPQNINTRNVAETRARQIIKYSKYSKSFWETRVN